MSASSALGSVEPCRICGGSLHPHFEGQILGRHLVTYHLCAGCGSLIIPSPHWLEEAYAIRSHPDADQGALQRTLFIHRCIRRMRATSVGLVPRRCRSLDFGAGRGLLLRLLLDEGKEAWGLDPYPNAVFAEDRVRTDFPEGRFDLITAVEVIEHTLDPVTTLTRLRECLEPRGLLLMSTMLYDAPQHGKDWIYLAPGYGQHVTFCSEQGLRHATRAAGLRWIGSLAWGVTPFAHLLVHRDRPVSALALWILRRRHAAGERRLLQDRRV